MFIFIILGAYALGCVCTGYYLVRWRVGEDIRQSGSGNVGAKNVGRRLGAPWFAATLAGDAAKGAAAVLAARYAGGGAALESAALLGALAGHVWPVQLGFRGGKGVAVFLGAVLAIDARLLVLLLLTACAVMLITRRFTVSGLAGVAFAPVAAYGLGRGWPLTGGLAAAAVIMLVAHRENLQGLLREARPEASGREV